MDTSLAGMPMPVQASSPATLRTPAPHTTEHAPLQDRARGVDKLSVDDTESRKAAERAQDIRLDVPEPPPRPIIETSRHEATGAYMLSFLDPETREVLQQIPSKRYLDLISSLIASWDKDKADAHGG